ncbi:MAG TPA: hypothetical protein VMI06_12975 [Terriglobia bacterium]|nr:hypothetical protein [Terriglobia bacterium]
MVIYSHHLMSGEDAEVQVEQSEGLIQAVVIDADGQEHTPCLLDDRKRSTIPN